MQVFPTITGGGLTETQKRRLRRKKQQETKSLSFSGSMPIQSEGSDMETDPKHMASDPIQSEDQGKYSPVSAEHTLMPTSGDSPGWLSIPLVIARTLLGKVSGAISGPSFYEQRVKELEKKVLEITAELQNIRAPGRRSSLSPNDDVPMPPSLDDVPTAPSLSPGVPQAPPMDIPEAPPMDDLPQVAEKPAFALPFPRTRTAPTTPAPPPGIDFSQLAGVKLRSGNDSSRPDRRPTVVTLDDLKGVKLRPSTPRDFPEKVAPTRPGMIDFSQMSKIKLKTRHDRSPGGTPMKQDRPDTSKMTLGGNVNLNLFDVRKRLHTGSGSQAADSVPTPSSRMDETPKRPMNGFEAETPTTAPRAPPPTPSCGADTPSSLLLKRRPLFESSISPTRTVTFKLDRLHSMQPPTQPHHQHMRDRFESRGKENLETQVSRGLMAYAAERPDAFGDSSKDITQHGSAVLKPHGNHLNRAAIQTGIM
jgi:hypothetical protein